MKVLIVEDDPDLGHLLKQYLQASSMEAELVYNGEEARIEITRNKYDILLLDVMMPKEDGFVLAGKLKSSHPDLPFLFLTARKMKEDIIKGLKLGADDYILKPFDADELILRIQNILKRSKKLPMDKPGGYPIGIYNFEPHNFRLVSPVSEHLLTIKEVQLLQYLYQHKNQLVRREVILSELWHTADFFKGRSMDVFISRLRKYFLEDHSIQIESIRGIGVRFTIGQ